MSDLLVATTPCSGSAEHCVDAGDECTQWCSASKCEGSKTHKWSNIGLGKKQVVPQKKKKKGGAGGAVTAGQVGGALQLSSTAVMWLRNTIVGRRKTDTMGCLFGIIARHVYGFWTVR